MVDPSDVLAGKVLIVDDQQASVRLLERMLHGAGYACVSSTRDPHEVSELHRKERYDLILLDLQMPGLDGIRVLEALKQVETDDYLSVLVMTAHPGNKRRALQAGAKDFISKPFDAVEVLTRVYNLLELRLLHMENKRKGSKARKTRSGAHPLPSADSRSPLRTT
jgi:CheY-like chemotaxis protein